LPGFEVVWTGAATTTNCFNASTFSLRFKHHNYVAVSQVLFKMIWINIVSLG
jgi:hypothetical protein